MRACVFWMVELAKVMMATVVMGGNNNSIKQHRKTQNWTNKSKIPKVLHRAPPNPLWHGIAYKSWRLRFWASTQAVTLIGREMLSARTPPKNTHQADLYKLFGCRILSTAIEIRQPNNGKDDDNDDEDSSNSKPNKTTAIASAPSSCCCKTIDSRVSYTLR